MSTSVLQMLYDSEINFKLSSLYDGGFDWWLGDEFNGYRASGTADSYDDAEMQLAEAAVAQWPASDFAKSIITRRQRRTRTRYR